MAEPTDDEPDQKTTTISTTTTTTTWGTLEELLLACAVNRHGTTSWDSVAAELHKRFSTSSSISLFTPQICQQKYRDLKRRFAGAADGGGDGGNTGDWLDELRRLRVAELRRELERYDVSIVSLQSKVKRLKEEREQIVEEEERENPDLQVEAKFEPPETVTGGRRNESMNESNSTDRRKEPDTEPETEPVEPEHDEPDRVHEPAGEADSCNGSSNSKKRDSGKAGGDQVDSGELVESVSESKGSDVQSAASLSKKRREKKLVVVSGNSSGDENQSAAVKSTSSGKSQPLIEFFEVVRAHKLGSVFWRRLESQETQKYKSLIRQHIDLGMIQRRLEEGQYAGCNTKFYRDLMLLINNAIVFFTNNSSEHKAALELRQLVTKQLQSRSYSEKSQAPKPHPPPPPPKPPKSEPDPITTIKPKLAITGPVIACRKRSSIAGKPSGTGERKEPAVVTPPAGEKTATTKEVVKQPREEKTSSSPLSNLIKKRTRDQSFGSKSSSTKNTNNNSNSKSNRPSSSTIQKTSPSTPASGKGENSETKLDKKKLPNPENSSIKIKRASGSGNGTLLDLLKNSAEKKNGNNSSGGNKSDRRKDQEPRSKLVSKPGKETAKGKEERDSPANRNIGRPPKRAAAIAAMGKRGREGSGEAEALAKKRQRK